MLSAKELKTVINTLNQRRTYLRKAIEEGKIDPRALEDSAETLKHLDSAVQKLTPSKPTTDQKSENHNEVKRAIPFQEARVLVGEDSEESAVILMDLLADMGIKTIHRATDGIDTFDKIKRAETPYHLILCDWNMPEISGLEVLARARASKTLGNTQFIMVTGVTEAPRIKQAVQQGIHGYVAKPIDPDVLEEKVKSALGHSKEN